MYMVRYLYSLIHGVAPLLFYITGVTLPLGSDNFSATTYGEEGCKVYTSDIRFSRDKLKGDLYLVN